MSETETTKTPRGNIIARLWRGDVSLAQTYWLYGAVGGTSLRLISPQVTYTLLSRNLSSDTIVFFQYGWAAFVILYTLFIFVAIWRSANKYAAAKPEKKGNATAAKTMVVLGALMLCGSIVKMDDNRLTSGSSGVDDQMQLEATIKGLNAGLPRKLDEFSILNKIDIHDDTVFYYISLSTEVADLEGLRSNLTKRLKSVCTDKDLSPILKGNNTLAWVYSHPSARDFMRIDIKKSDCPDL